MSGARAQFGRTAAPTASPAVLVAGPVPGSPSAAQAVAARRVGARVGRAAMPALPPAAPVALVLAPAQLAPRRQVSGAGRSSRGPIAVPVLALAVVALTWMDAAVLRAKDAHPQAVAGSIDSAGGEDTPARSARPGPLGVVRRDHTDESPEATASGMVAASNAGEPELEN